MNASSSALTTIILCFPSFPWCVKSNKSHMNIQFFFSFGTKLRQIGEHKRKQFQKRENLSYIHLIYCQTFMGFLQSREKGSILASNLHFALCISSLTWWKHIAEMLLTGWWISFHPLTCFPSRYSEFVLYLDVNLFISSIYPRLTFDCIHILELCNMFSSLSFSSVLNMVNYFSLSAHSTLLHLACRTYFYTGMVLYSTF